MPTLPATRRLSPKVRRLLQDHALDPRIVPGTGAEGRITARDVLTAAGHGPAARQRVLASPLARRVLRDAGVELTAAARANDGRRLTRATAEQAIGRLDGTGAPRPGTPGRSEDSATSTGEVEVDVARLLADIAAVRQDFVARNGFELAAEVAVASAAATVLVRHPDLAIDTAEINLGFPHPEGGDVAVVPDAHHLTVAGLARRARAALDQREPSAASSATAPPAVVVTTDTTSPAEVSTSGAIGLLTVSAPSLRDVADVDELGHAVVRSRPHSTIRLHHDDRTSPAAAAAFLEELGAAVASWSLPVGP